MATDSSNDPSCYEVASSSKPSTKLYQHIVSSNVSLRPNRVKHDEIMQLKSESKVDFSDKFEKPAEDSSPWSLEFASFRPRNLAPTSHVNRVIAAPDSWTHEFIHRDAKASSWALEFSRISSLLEENSVTSERELNDLFVKFESAWNSSATWNEEFTGQDAVQVDAIPDPVYENIWNKYSHKSTGSQQYLFEENNPFLAEVDPLTIGLNLLSNIQGSLTEAALALEAAIQRLDANDPMLGHAWLMLGNCQAENEKENAALLAYEQSLRIDPNNPDTLLALAVSLTNEAHDERLVNVLWKWLKIVTNSPSMDALEDRGKLARSLLETINQKTADTVLSANLQIALGLLFYSMGSFERSIDCFKTALNISPDDYLLWNRMGATLANNHQSEKAVMMYEKALAIKPSFVRALHNLGVSCMNMGCYAEAAEYLIRALKAQHMNPNIPPPTKHISTNLWETLRRNFIFCDRIDLAALCETRSLEQICIAIEEADSWIPHPASGLD